MTTAYGLTTTGFVIKRLVDIQAEINASLQSVFGPAVDLDPSEPLGQVSGIMAERESLLWELAQAVYNSAYPDTASDVSLDNAVALTGIARKAQSFSRVLGAFFYGTNATVVPKGSLVQVAGNAASLFATDADVTITQVIEVQSIAFTGVAASGTFILNFGSQSTAPIAWNATALAIQAALRLLSAASGPAPTGLSGVTVTGLVTAGPVIVTMTGTNGPQTLLTVTTSLLTAGAVSVPGTATKTTTGSGTAGNLTATVAGPVAAPIASLTVIQSPTSGWTAVSNPAVAVLGLATETDAALKLRRQQSLQKAGASTVPAIRAAVLAVAGVTAATVFENTTSVTDGSGRPAKCFEALVQGGLDQDVANAVWGEKPAGIQAYGTSSASVTDSQGTAHTVGFSRPTLVPIYVTVALTTTAAFPGGGDALVTAAVVAYGASLGMGDPVVIIPGMVAHLATVPGITGAVIHIGLAPSPGSSSNIVVTPTQLATIDAVNVVVTP